MPLGSCHTWCGLVFNQLCIPPPLTIVLGCLDFAHHFCLCGRRCERSARPRTTNAGTLSLQGRKSAPTPKFLGKAKAYFVCHIGPDFQISLVYAFIGCPQSVCATMQCTIFEKTPQRYGQRYHVIMLTWLYVIISATSQGGFPAINNELMINSLLMIVNAYL